ncbi:unnamed protein product, partial [marine sediment metagenome]
QKRNRTYKISLKIKTPVIDLRNIVKYKDYHD